jgi:hypothetical protein
MKQRMDGMVLLSTVLMLFVMAALMCSMLKATWLYAGLSTRTQASHKAYYALETTLLTLLHTSVGMHDTACSSQTRDVNHARYMLQTGHGCVKVEHDVVYQYWWSDLGLDAHASDRHWLLAVRQAHRQLLVRISEKKEIVSWRYLID